MIRKIWPDSAWGKMAALIVLAALAAPAAYLLGVWSILRDWLSILWDYLAASTIVPNWILVLLIICALIVCGLFGASLRPKRESADPDRWQ